MIDVDELLTGAAARLDVATANLPIPGPPRAAAPVGRIIAAAACAAAAVGAMVVVGSRDRHRQPQAPPGLLEGSYGTEITLNEVADGDDDPTTWKVVAAPAGGAVSVERQSTATTAAVAATVPGGTADTIAAAPNGSAELCLMGTGAGGSCPPDPGTFTLTTSNRSDADGQALVSGIPADTYAVTFRAGDIRYWARPVHGIAAFPYPGAAAALSTATAIAGDGTILATATQHDSTLTGTEIAAAAITSGTGDTIPGGWYAPTDVGTSIGGIITRLEGRTGQIGFGGPFTAQGLVVDTDHNLWLQVITVHTGDVDEVTARLDSGGRGSVRRTVAEAAGLTVLLWADDDVSDTTIDNAGRTLSQTNPTPEYVRPMDGPQAFTAASPIGIMGTPGLWALLSEPLDAPLGEALRIQGDDLGNLRVARLAGTDASSVYATVDIGPNGERPAVPQVGAAVFSLTPVPSDVRALGVTLDDGTTAALALVDLQPYADAKVALAPDDLAVRTIRTVDVDDHG